MTRKQNEIINMMEEMVKNEYAEKISNTEETVKVYTANYDGLRAFLVITPDDFRMYANEGALKNYHCGKLEILSKRAYPTFEYTVSNIKSDYERDKRNKEYEEERIRKLEAKRNDPNTIKVDYYNSLIEKYYDEPGRFNKGEWTVLSGYNDSRDHGFSKLILDDLRLYNEQDYNDFDDILKEGNISEFILSETSTALLRYLNNLDQIGWKMNGLERINYTEETWRGLENKEIVGIQLRKVA